MTEQRVMALFWGVCLLTSGWMTHVEASVSENLEKSIDELKAHYIKDDHPLNNGHPIFLRILRKELKESEQMLLMSIIIDTYSRIFASMKNDSQDEATQERLQHVQEHLTKLQENYFHGKSDLLKTNAETLWAVKENDPVVQQKALFELKRVFRVATELKDMKNKDRRRRQAKSLRLHKSKQMSHS